MKKLTLRRLLVALCAGASLVAGTAMAAYPTQPVTIVVNFAAGGPLDALARTIAVEAGKSLGQSVIVENKTGAGGMIGAEYVSRAKPDGHTLLLSVDTLATVVPYVYTQNKFNANDALEPITTAGTFNQVLVARKDLGVSTMKEFIELATKESLTYASAGAGSPGQLTMEALKLAQPDLKLVHVPFKGAAPATNSLLGGQVDTGFLVVAGVSQHIEAKNLVPLAVSGTTRDSLLPNTPTIAELKLQGLEDFDIGFGYVLMAPKGTPPEVIDTWNKLIAKLYQEPAVLERLKAMNIEPTRDTPEQAKQRLKDIGEKWKVVIKEADIKIE